MRDNKAKVVALNGILVALALILSWVERQTPVFFATPGMKLGLTNLVVLIALYCIGPKSALVINAARILLVGFLFGNGISILYSLAGGMLSTTVMILLKRTEKLNIITVSIIGGICHNTGQILVAMALLQTTSLAYYMVILWFAGLGAGAVIGLLGGILTKRLNIILKKSHII